MATMPIPAVFHTMGGRPSLVICQTVRQDIGDRSPAASLQPERKPPHTRRRAAAEPAWRSERAVHIITWGMATDHGRRRRASHTRLRAERK